jgi:hypothetical protein
MLAQCRFCRGNDSEDNCEEPLVATKKVKHCEDLTSSQPPRLLELRGNISLPRLSDGSPAMMAERSVTTHAYLSPRRIFMARSRL